MCPLEPTSKPDTLHDSVHYWEDSLIVRQMVSLRPDLQFCSPEQDTVLHCQDISDISETAPSLFLVLLAPLLGEVLLLS